MAEADASEGVTLRRPTRRACERCGRVEHWDEDAHGWRVKDPGTLFCVHEWDINGSFLPFEGDSNDTSEPAE